MSSDFETKLDNKISSMIKYVEENIDSFRLWSGEKFYAFKSGLMCSTVKDSQGDVLSEEDLDHLMDFINSSKAPYWMYVEHDISNPPVGRAIYSDKFFTDENIYLICISGLYEKSNYSELEDITLEEMKPFIIPKFTPPEGPVVSIAYDRHFTSKESIEKSLLNSPYFVSKNANILQQKSMETTAVVIIALPVLMFAFGAYSKGALQELGKEHMQIVQGWIRWVIDDLIPNITEDGPVTLLNETKIGETKVNFIVPNGRENMLRDAFSTVDEYLPIASSIIDRVKRAGGNPDFALFKYDVVRKAWKPCYINTTNHGVIACKETLLALEYFDVDKLPDFSISRTISSEVLNESQRQIETDATQQLAEPDSPTS